MADDQTQTAAPDDQTQALLNQMLRQTLTGQAAQPAEPPHSGDNRTWGSLLGQALVGGAGPGSTDAANEQAGLRALQSIGLGMMAGSDYSQARHSLGSIVAGAIGGAQESNAAQNAAQLEYQKTQQEMQLARVKEAVPLLTLMQTQQQLANARNIALGNKPTGANVNIGAVGAVPSGILAPNEAPINAAGDSATRKAAEGGPPAPGTPAAKVAQQVHDFWISKGFSEPVVAGIMAGGPGSESNFDPTASGDKGSSYGLYQHHAERLDGMRKMFGLSGDQMPSADQQNQYAAWELSPQGPKAAVGAALSKAQTPAEAAAIYTRSFGVPADKTEIGRRAAGAGRFLGPYTPQQPPGAPSAPATAQTPPAASTAAPGVAQGDVAHPELAPGPPGSTGGAPIGIGAALAPPVVAGAPQLPTKGSPIPTGKLLKSDNADAIMEGVKLAQTTQPGGVQTAGPGAGPSLPPSPVAAPLATPQPGWGAGAATGYNVTPSGAAAAAPPPPPSTQVQPQAQPTAAQPDAFPPFTYQRGPLPASIQARIDNPAAHVSPDLTTALQVAAQSGDIGKMAAAKAAIGAAADAVRTKALEEGEAYQTNERNKAQELHVKNAEAVQQNQRDAAARQQAIDLANVNAENTRKQNVESAVLAVSQKRLEDLNARSGIAQRIIRDSRTLEALAPQLGDPNVLLANNPRLRDTLVSLNLPGLAGANLDELRAQQVWDKLVTGFFQDTHVPGSGSQSNVEGEWMMRQFGGPEQTVEDRLTQLAIVRKLADHRITDNRDAEDLFTRQNGKLTGLDERIAQRNKLFDRPPDWNVNNPQANLATQNRYLLRHPRGEPYAAWSSPDGGATSGEMRYFRNEMVSDPKTGKARLQPVPLLGGALVAEQ